MKRSIKIAATTAAAVSSAMLVKKAKENKVEEKENTYRNTELGKHDKNSKGIYYTNGNYEAFARPKKPEGVENKSAYLIGSGLASLAAACFLVRDGQMPGKNIHILEAMDIAGGACDGIFDPTAGYIMRGGREMENHFECLWDLFRSIPSLEIKDASVLDEFYWLNKEDPNYSLCRATVNRGQDAKTNNQFGLSQKGCMEIMKLFMTKDEDLYDKTIEDVFDEEVFDSTFWMYWRTMFAFENWHSALEMKLYFQRFIHHISGLPDFSALKFTRYNQYESLILPMKKYLEKHGVDFQFNSEVTNIIFDTTPDKKVAKVIECKVNGKDKNIQLTEKVKRNPYSIVLLDEIEKAHPDVFNILLQVLDDGRLTDAQGNTVSFENTIIIMTSNAGSNLNNNSIGFGGSRIDSSKMISALKETFRPEFLNRVDEIVVFEQLNQEQLLQIVDLMLNDTKKALDNKDIKLEVSQDAKKTLLNKGTDIKYGARPLRRAIQRYLEDELSDMILRSELHNGQTVLVTSNEDSLNFEIKD